MKTTHASQGWVRKFLFPFSSRMHQRVSFSLFGQKSASRWVNKRDTSFFKDIYFQDIFLFNEWLRVHVHIYMMLLPELIEDTPKWQRYYFISNYHNSFKEQSRWT